MKRLASIAPLFLALFLVGCAAQTSSLNPDSSQGSAGKNQSPQMIVGGYKDIFTALTEAIEKEFTVYWLETDPEHGKIRFTGKGTGLRGDVQVFITLKPASGVDSQGKTIKGFALDIKSSGVGPNFSMHPIYASNNINEAFLKLMSEYDLTMVDVHNPTLKKGGGKGTAGKASGCTGSGFAVDASGHIITNAHVVDKAKNISVVVNGNKVQANVVKVDTVNDLALLKIDMSVNEFLKIRKATDLRAGDEVVVAGYPLRGTLASELNITTGTVSALSGLHDDIREMQISAPVQPGNSGGPVFDRYGCVCGVVVSKYNAVNSLITTGDIPQNINFAINLFFLKAFLETNSIAYGFPSKLTKLESADVADIARKATFLIIVEY